MFENLLVENFKSFPRLELNGLGRVNLFFGRNNCRKTSLLEAVFILSGLSNPQLPYTCNRFRELGQVQDISLFFHDLNTDGDIRIASSSKTPNFSRQLIIRPLMKFAGKTGKEEKTS